MGLIEYMVQKAWSW